MEAPVIGATITASVALLVVVFNSIWDKRNKRMQYILENETIIEIIPHQNSKEKFLVNEEFKNGKSYFCNGLALVNLMQHKSDSERIHYFSVVNSGENLVKDLTLEVKINDDNAYRFFKTSFDSKEKIYFSAPEWNPIHRLEIIVRYTSLANIEYKVIEKLFERYSAVETYQRKRELYIKKNLKKKRFKKIKSLNSTIGHNYDTAYMDLKNFTADFSEKKANKD